MKILALEFSSPQRSVAVVSASRKMASEVIETGPRNTMRPLGMVEEALKQTAFEREQIECVAIGLGPGSYTGIRAAIALAQGWQLARDVKLLGLSSVQCMAVQAQAGGFTGKACIVIDAQRKEFYIASYEIDANECREFSPLRLASSNEVQERQKAGEVLFGPEVDRWFPGATVMFPRAATLGRLAMGRNDFIPGEKLEPIYLREMDFVKAPPPRVLPVR